MKIFDLDSPLMNVLNKMADLMWLNILTLICCIPIITAGAAFTSMHYVALKIVRNEESYITRSFFKSFKTNFLQATLIWLMLLAVAAVLGGDYYIITRSGMEFSKVLIVLIMAAGVLVICTSLYVFPVLAKFDNTILNTIKNAFFMAIGNLPRTLLMAAVIVGSVVLTFLSQQTIAIGMLVWIMVGFALIAFLNAHILVKVFDKYIPQEEEDSSESVIDGSVFQNLHPVDSAEDNDTSL